MQWHSSEKGHGIYKHPSRSCSSQSLLCSWSCSPSSTAPVVKGPVKNKDSCKFSLDGQNPPTNNRGHSWKFTCSWHSWQKNSCQFCEAKLDQYLSRYVLLIAQSRSVGILCSDTIHGVLCLWSRPAVHLERSGYPLKRVSLNPSLGETTITHF